MPPRISTDEELDSELLYILNQHVGKANAIKRWDLVAKIFGPVAAHLQNDGNVDDRRIREAVNRLRSRAHLICDLGNAQGRYLANNEAEFWEFYASYLKPLKARSEILRVMKKAAQEKWPNLLQPSLFSIDELESV